MIFQIAYISLSHAPLSSDVLSDILEVSQHNNGRDGITGILMYHDMLFFQILEGPLDAVKSTYHDRILNDPRHTSLSLVWDGLVNRRTFPKWLMRYAGPDRVDRHSLNQEPDFPDLAAQASENDDGNSIALELARQVFASYQAPAKGTC